MVQWLRISLPMQGTWVRSLVRELRSHMPQDDEACEAQEKILNDATKIPHATTKTQHSQVNKQVNSKRQERKLLLGR